MLESANSIRNIFSHTSYIGWRTVNQTEPVCVMQHTVAADGVHAGKGEEGGVLQGFMAPYQ